MKPRIEEQIVMRMLYYPETNKVVAHLYDGLGRLKYRAAVEAYDALGFRAMAVSLLAALGAKVESDPTL